VPTLRPIDRGVFDALGLPCLEANPEDARKIARGKPLREVLGMLELNRLSADNPGICAAAVFSGDSLLAVIERAGETAQWKYGYVYARD